MRSSDWSSDVCSSDLRAERRVKRVELQLQAIGQPHLDTVAKTQLLDRRGGDIDALLVQLGKFGRPEIERALSQKRDLGPISPQEFSRSEERRVGKECVRSVELGGRRMIKKKNNQKKKKKTIS